MTVYAIRPGRVRIIYQTLINAALLDHIRHEAEPLEKTLRRVLREELRKAG